MKRYVFFVFAILSALVSQAKDIREIWLSMPDSLMVYLDKSKRIEMVDYIDMKVKAEVRNTLEGMSVMDTLTHDYLQVTINDAYTLQMRTLPTVDGDTVWCLVKTFSGPQAESEVFVYGKDWRQMRQLTFPQEDFIAKPDTMSDTSFADLKRLVDVSLVEAQLSIDEETLTLNASPILLNEEERERVRAILPSRTLRWDGKDFH